MRHAADGVLRRLDDEPLAIPDRIADHVAGCARCSARRARIAEDTERAAGLLSAPQPGPSVDMAWARLKRELQRTAQGGAGGPQRRVSTFRRPSGFPTVSWRGGVIVGAVGIVIAGTAAAATLTTILAPTRVAPVSLSRTDVQAVASFMGLGDSHVLGGFPAPSGSSTVRFGTIRWSSSGPAGPASSLAEATAEAGFQVPLPARLPAGVGAIQGYIVQPRVTATVTFKPTAARVGGSSVTLDAGPAVLVEYAAASRANLPTLGIVTMRRPTALSTGASMSQIEGFLLNQPGIPPELAEEVRLLGDLGTTLPVPVPRGALVRSVHVAGWPGVLVADPSNAAGGVVWEDGGRMLHAVAGILDSQDLLNVADQLG